MVSPVTSEDPESVTFSQVKVEEACPWRVAGSSCHSKKVLFHFLLRKAVSFAHVEEIVVAESTRYANTPRLEGKVHRGK